MHMLYVTTCQCGGNEMDNQTHKYENHSHQNKAFTPHNKDPYQIREKLSEPSHCSDCGAVYDKGHWIWGKPTIDSTPHRCPACSRIKDKVPAGFLTLKGPFLTDHKQEILHLVKNLEEREKLSHPLERIMTIEDAHPELIICFTGMHLAKATGDAIHHAYQGSLDIQFVERDSQIRIEWER